MKKRNLSVFAVILSTLVIGFFSLMTAGTIAQKSASDKTNQPTCTGKPFVIPESISVNNEAFADFIKRASLPMKERREAFFKETNEQKASYIKVNLALQFIKRPNMTSDQKEFVLDMMSKVSANIYDKSDPEKAKLVEADAMAMVNRALGLFPMKEAGDFIEPMQTDKYVEVALLQKYEDLLKNGMIKRREVAKDMSVADRINIWKVQLVYHLATGKFSRAQNEFILEQMASLSPETFSSRANVTTEEDKKAFDTLASSIYSVFSKEEGFAVFMTIGIQREVKDDPDFLSKRASTCDCLISCTQSSGVCDGVHGCTSSSSGCGPWDTFGCHYKCWNG
jgi:hypothetical protein